MDLIYANAAKVDQGVLSAYAFDLAYGADENDFELALPRDAPRLETGAFIYISGTEYGGIIDGFKADSDGDTIVYIGRTWHGILNSKFLLQEMWTISGDANEVLAAIISHIGLDGLFTVKNDLCGLAIEHEFTFEDFPRAYDAIRKVFGEYGMKLKMRWMVDRRIHIEAVPAVDYTSLPIDGDMGFVSLETHETKANHLLCVWDKVKSGEVVKSFKMFHLYVDRWGRIGDVQDFTGVSEIVEMYESSKDTEKKARKDAIEKFEELRETDKAEIRLPDAERYVFDVGDIVGAAHIELGAKVAAPVTQKIVKISNGTMETEYKVGGEENE